MLFDFPDVSQFQNFTADLDLSWASLPVVDGWQVDASEPGNRVSWDHFENLQARVADVMQSETASVPDERLTTSLIEDDPFVSQGKDYRIATEGEEEEEIVVVGKRKSQNEIVWDGGGTGGETTGGDGGLFSGGGEPYTPPANDADQIDVTINAKNLTPEQEKALEELLKAIGDADRIINNLADNEKITLKDGSTVTGKELKDLWAKTDFVINPQGYDEYENGTLRGEANLNGGDPVISYNVDLVHDYYDPDGAPAMVYLVLHELGHLTAANRAFDTAPANPDSAVEQMANDIARAIANDGGVPILSDPGYGYGTDDPIVFRAGSTGGGGGGPGGGGGGCGGDGSGEETCW